MKIPFFIRSLQFDTEVRPQPDRAHRARVRVRRPSSVPHYATAGAFLTAEKPPAREGGGVQERPTPARIQPGT